MADTFTETATTGLFGRLGKSIKGIVVGVVLFIAAFPVLIWNESRAVERFRLLDEGRGAVVEVGADAVGGADGDLVFVTGEATSDGVLRDEVFGVEAPALRLRRTVEMYQWDEQQKTETKKKLGGGEEKVTTYTYRKVWSDKRLDSSRFRQPEGHENPAAMPVPGETFDADPIRVGAWTLSAVLVRQVNNFEPLAVTAERVPPAATQRSTAEKPIRPHGGGFYIGESPGSPAVGDARVTFHVAEPGPVSVLAGKAGSTFTEWASPKGRRLEQNLRTAAVTADGFFADLEASNRMMTWLLRLAGFAMMFIGVSMVLAPLRVAADIVPLFGGIVGIGIGLVAVLIALPLSLVTIAIAWVAVRPLLGIPLLLIGVAGIVAVVWWLRRRRAVAAEARAGVEAA